MQRATAEAGALFVAAAGNGGVNLDSEPRYPACFRLPGMMVVGASNARNTPLYTSNFGE